MKQTFVLGANARGEPWIECLVCGSRSFHREDIRQEYCGGCHQFHFVLAALSEERDGAG